MDREIIRKHIFVIFLKCSKYTVKFWQELLKLLKLHSKELLSISCHAASFLYNTVYYTTYMLQTFLSVKNVVELESR